MAPRRTLQVREGAGMSKLWISATESATELGLAFPAQPRCGYCSTNCSHECFLFNSREKHSGKLFCFLF